ncbi:CoA transferase [Cupriavidus basilensis]
MAQFVLGDHMGGLTFEPPIGPSGYARILDHNRRPHRTKDGYLCVLFYNDKQWRKFFELGIGQPRPDGPRSALCHHRRPGPSISTRCTARVAEVMPTRTTAEWIEVLEAADMPVMQLHTIDSLMADPHLQSVGFLRRGGSPDRGRVIRSMAIPSACVQVFAAGLPGQAPRLGVVAQRGGAGRGRLHSGRYSQAGRVGRNRACPRDPVTSASSGVLT